MKLDHLVILVSDLTRCLPFYEAVLPLLGFRRIRANVFENEDGLFLDFRAADEPDRAYHRHAPGLNHMGFVVSDRAELERIARALERAGVPVPELQEFPDGSSLFLKDVDGMRIELSCYRESSGGED